jgi:hypothetical protein
MVLVNECLLILWCFICRGCWTGWISIAQLVTEVSATAVGCFAEAVFAQLPVSRHDRVGEVSWLLVRGLLAKEVGLCFGVTLGTESV